MIKVKCGGTEYRYYSVSEAARLITKNQWGVPVTGIHSETLRRAWRDKVDAGKSHGYHIGRDVFFTLENLEALGYEAQDASTYIDIGNIVELIPTEEESE